MLQNHNGVDSALKNRAAVIEEQGLKDQPFILVIGEGKSVKQHLVIVETARYHMTSFLQALDVCFKSYQSLLALYPVESFQVWLFIQKFLYEISTKWDPVEPGVETLINDLKRL